MLKLDGVGKTQTIDVDIDYHPGMVCSPRQSECIALSAAARFVTLFFTWIQAPKSCLGVCLSVLVRLAFLGLVWRVILK